MSEYPIADEPAHNRAEWIGKDPRSRPLHFGDAAAEYTAAREAVAVFDLTDRTSLELRGGDRQSFLNNFCTNDVKRLAPGEGCEAFLTNIKGRILGHIIVSATDEALWIDSDPGTAEAIAAHLDKYIITEDVEIIDHTDGLMPLYLTGPNADEWLTQHSEGFSAPGCCGQIACPVNGIDVVVRRVDFTSQPGFELVATKEKVAELWTTIIESSVRPAGWAAYETLRIEAGFPRYGVDLTEENIAQEAGRTEQAISFTKGCYLGQEPIARLDALGHVNRLLCRLTIASDTAPSASTPVCATDDKQIGRITSAEVRPTDGAVVALALLRAAFAKRGAEVRVGNDRSPAAVVSP